MFDFRRATVLFGIYRLSNHKMTTYAYMRGAWPLGPRLATPTVVHGPRCPQVETQRLASQLWWRDRVLKTRFLNKNNNSSKTQRAITWRNNQAAVEKKHSSWQKAAAGSLCNFITETHRHIESTSFGSRFSVAENKTPLPPPEAQQQGQAMRFKTTNWRRSRGIQVEYSDAQWLEIYFLAKICEVNRCLLDSDDECVTLCAFHTKCILQLAIDWWGGRPARPVTK